MSDQGNGAEKSRLGESVLRFLGLAGQQQRGAREPRTPSAPPPSADELRAVALAEMLRGSDGGIVLIDMLDARLAEALDASKQSIRDHALCAAHLGEHSALQRLRDDLVRLKR